MSERYVVRDQAGQFFADFTSVADRFDPSGQTARERAMDWAALQQTADLELSVFREDTVPVGQSIKSVLVRRWPGQFIFS